MKDRWEAGGLKSGLISFLSLPLKRCPAGRVSGQQGLSSVSPEGRSDLLDDSARLDTVHLLVMRQPELGQPQDHGGASRSTCTVGRCRHGLLHRALAR